jgi:hypothetical protein
MRMPRSNVVQFGGEIRLLLDRYQWLINSITADVKASLLRRDGYLLWFSNAWARERVTLQNWDFSWMSTSWQGRWRGHLSESTGWARVLEWLASDTRHEQRAGPSCPYPLAARLRGRGGGAGGG